MRLLIVTQGQWGQRIAGHVAQTAPAGWQIARWQGPLALPPVIDEPRDYVPDTLPGGDLLLALTESAGMTDLVPDLAVTCGARAAIIPIDRRSWAPPGLVRQVKRRLAAAGIDCALPAPFCSLVPTRNCHALIREFAGRYGKPRLRLAIAGGQIAACHPLREAPCGNTRYIAQHLAAVAVEKAAERAGLLHHYYPCWGGMETDPVCGDHTLLHIAATLSQQSVRRAIEETQDRQNGRDDPLP